MKPIIFIISVCFTMHYSIAQGKKLAFEATYSEGFGVYMKRVFALKKIDPKKGVKGERHKRIYILVSKKNNRDELLPIDCSDELYAELAEAIKAKNGLRIVGVGYETIVASGIPSLSGSVNDDDIILPGGFGWSAGNVFRLDSFKIFKTPNSERAGRQ